MNDMLNRYINYKDKVIDLFRVCNIYRNDDAILRESEFLNSKEVNDYFNYQDYLNHNKFEIQIDYIDNEIEFLEFKSIDQLEIVYTKLLDLWIEVFNYNISFNLLNHNTYKFLECNIENFLIKFKSKYYKEIRWATFGDYCINLKSVKGIKILKDTAFNGISVLTINNELEKSVCIGDYFSNLSKDLKKEFGHSIEKVRDKFFEEICNFLNLLEAFEFLKIIKKDGTYIEFEFIKND